jgi:ubiquinone/menaquinone biosynthesis C-methylase UbiE/uncharacterized protein YbaR (Trm112 family)
VKPELVDILACPACLGSPLRLKVSRQQNEEVISGTLSCPSCGKEYPIEEKIPRMIPQSGEAAIRKMAGHEVGGIAADTEEVTRKHLEVRQANIDYHDTAADTYDEDEAESVHQNKFNQERIEGIIRDLSQKCGGQRFLDIGCGTGNVLKFGKKYFQHAVGIDASVNMLKLANERGMEVIQADALFLPFASNTFNVVSVFSVLHHIYDYSLALTQIGRVLGKDGFLYSDWDPNMQPPIYIDKEKLSGKVYYLLSFLYGPVSRLKNRLVYRHLVKQQSRHTNLREAMPEIKETYRLAEYHEQKPPDERGIDFEEVMRCLAADGFIDIQPTFHWQGKSFRQLGLTARVRLSLLSRTLGLPKERFMENIQIIARKGRLYEAKVS